jgi:hypothetical protein
MQHPTRFTSTIRTAGLLLAALAAPATAQEAARIIEQLGAAKVAFTPRPGETPLVPQPPRALHKESVHPDVRVPLGTGGRPQPLSEQAADVPFDRQLVTAGAFRYYMNEVVTPGALTTSDRTPEPSPCINRDTAFQTGNWYAALSRDSGQTWTGISPYTFFPAAAGGFCCDQKAIYVPSHDIVVWLLQYDANAAGNVYRFAVARGRANLRSGDNDDWYYYDFTAQDFGYAAGAWMDYPDLAFDGTWLHCSTNVFGIAGSNSVRWRMRLDNLRDGAALGWSFSTSAALLGWNYRFAAGVSGGKMFYAALKSTTEIYVYDLEEAGAVNNRVTRATAAWSDDVATCPGPDGRDWCGRAVGRIRGGAGNADEVVFLWSSASNGAGRPQPYTRVARFRTADKTLIDEHDIWNANYAYLYGSAYSNDQGDFGCVIAVGGGVSHPHTSCFIIDGYDAWPPAATYAMSSGDSGLSDNRFGDYFDVRRHHLNPKTWVAAGSAQNGGVGFTFAEPRYAWFGRDDFEPTWVNLSVQSNGVAAVPITIDETDRLNRKNGNTNFTRSFAPQQGYTLTAPLTHVSGGTTYVFCNWAIQTEPGGFLIPQAEGQRVYTTSSIGNLDDAAVAYYVARRTLQVRSINPNAGVAITVSVADINGNQNGNTAFDRFYKNGEDVTLTAPLNGAVDRPFKRWIVNGVEQPLGNRILNLDLDGTITATAEFWTHTAGSTVSYSAGCPGTAGAVPLHTVAGLPETGHAIAFRVTHAVTPGSPGILMVGPRIAPLPLAFLGMGPCTLAVNPTVTVPIVLNGAGIASVPWNVPDNAALIGSRLASQFTVLDPGTLTPMKLVNSNAVETTLGGVE